MNFIGGDRWWVKGGPLSDMELKWRRNPDASDAWQHRGVTSGGCERWRSRGRVQPGRPEFDKLIYRLTSLNLMFAGPRQINYICGTGSKSQVSPLQSATCQLDIKPIIIIFSVIRLVSQTRGLRIKLCNAQTRRSECCRVCVCVSWGHTYLTPIGQICVRLRERLLRSIQIERSYLVEFSGWMYFRVIWLRHSCPSIKFSVRSRN